MENPYIILAVDTSCDDTSAAVTVNDCVISNVISSQIELHKKWGGVVPILAKRAHEERIEAVVSESLARFRKIQSSKFKVQNYNSKFKREEILKDIDAFAVTIGPGLAPALEVGIRYVKNLAEKYEKPVIAVNHMEGHLLSSFAKNSEGNNSFFRHSERSEESHDHRSLGDKKILRRASLAQDDKTTFPLLGLLISGGHTQLVLMQDFGKYELLGETLDDAVGEAYDKVSKMLDLGYPGGPIIERLAKAGDAQAFKLPIPMRKRTDVNYNFSYSGIKTALMYLIKDLKKEDKLDKQTIQNVAASFQRVVTISLIDKLGMAVKNTHPKGLLLGGGVISNLYIRNHIRIAMKKHNLPVYIPYSRKLFTDNAAMIGIAAYYQSRRDDFVMDISSLDRKPNLSF